MRQFLLAAAAVVGLALATAGPARAQVAWGNPYYGGYNYGYYPNFGYYAPGYNYYGTPYTYYSPGYSYYGYSGPRYYGHWGGWHEDHGWHGGHAWHHR